MRFTRSSKSKPCGCRSAGECMHNIYGEEDSLDALVNAFAKEMKLKLREIHEEGRRGWDDPAWTREEIIVALKEHLAKGDPIDIANFAAFIWNREA